MTATSYSAASGAVACAARASRLGRLLRGLIEARQRQANRRILDHLAGYDAALRRALNVDEALIRRLGSGRSSGCA